jgi:hypothetical protein
MFTFIVVLAALSAVPSWAAEGIISKFATSTPNYCHLKFRAIQWETLYWDRPVLEHPGSSRIIDFYGPCDYDPLGKAEIRRQQRNRQRIESRDSSND